MEISKKKNILYLASHGFAVRMLLQTNLLGKLAERNFKVGIVTNDASDPSVSAYCKANGIENIEFSSVAAKSQGNYELFRRYLLEDVKRNPALYEKHLRLKDQAKKRLSVKARLLCCNILYTGVQAFPSLRKLFKKVERQKLNDPQADALIETYRPDLVISTYPVNSDEALLLNAAQKKSIKTVTHLLSWDNITCKGRFKSVSDIFISWGPIMKNELVKYYAIEPGNIYNTGVPHFDNHFKFKNVKEQNNGKQYMLFAMSSPYFAPREIDIVEKIASWIEAGEWPGVEFIVRPHPQNVIGNMADLNWLPRLQKLESKLVHVNYPDLNEQSQIGWSMKLKDMDNLSQLVSGSAIVLNSCSTMTIDALYLEKPVIITAFDNEEALPWHISVKRVMEYEHFRNIVKSGGVKVVKDYKELKKSITAYLDDPAVDLVQRKEILKQEMGENDGMATDRVVAAIETIAAG